ncbi:alpha/beta hydrolase [Nocardia stercoris]|uniref:Esterase family protein n=1 Tax=Nocardia stercoris TaxID=2483361 RepID=A0A3M2L6D9_9NOCA|nr:alpha/beta hydrolase family protein [Nocardia stercoris]RMI30098.1 esterase family protein [Nocardia stercoris]
MAAEVVRRGRVYRLLASVLPAVALAALVPAVATVASSDPGAALPDPAVVTPAPDGSRIAAVASGPGREVDVSVYSTAMAAVEVVKVLPAADGATAAPALYLLNGANGGLGDSSWTEKTDIATYFADQQVNVVVPMGGRGSYFADWRADDPVLGHQRWTTFLTRELPPLIDAAFHGSGAAAVAGISMAGTSVFQLALAAPGRYRGVGSYSGCAPTSDLTGQLFVDAVVARWAGNAANMWGPPGDPQWAAVDPYVHAEDLRGLALYVSAGTGVPGPLDTLAGPGIDGDPIKLVDQDVSGGFIEAIAGTCARRLQQRFADLGIPATFDLHPDGTHSWGYWQQELHNSWPLFRAALGE